MQPNLLDRMDFCRSAASAAVGLCELLRSMYLQGPKARSTKVPVRWAVAIPHPDWSIPALHVGSFKQALEAPGTLTAFVQKDNDECHETW